VTVAKQSHTITPVGAYPLLLTPQDARAALTYLRSSEAVKCAARAIAMKGAEMRGAVLKLVDVLEGAVEARGWPEIFHSAHEIRGLAATAGLAATGRMANTLCQYLDALHVAGVEPDATVVGLHTDAIARSARTEDEAARHGDKVAMELAALVARRLSEIKVSETGA
jgi:chemotaxis protein histidine kinase CheA